MNTCKEFDILSFQWKNQILILIKKMCGKSNISDITIEKSELKNYEFKVTVGKYTANKGWATIGYLRNDIFRGGIWRLSYRPKLTKDEKSEAGRTGKYN